MSLTKSYSDEWEKKKKQQRLESTAMLAVAANIHCGNSNTLMSTGIIFTILIIAV